MAKKSAKKPKKQSLTYDTLMAFVSADAQSAIREEGESLPESGVLMVELNQIQPDLEQPRQLISAELLTPITTGTSAEKIFKAWQKTEGDSKSFTELARLADSIAQHGLINPITIRPNPAVSGNYLIVTGERRFWAHILLNSQDRAVADGKSTRTPSRIPCIVVSEGVRIRAHQLVENLIREDMNAIEKGRGLWALRYELSNVTYRLQSADSRETKGESDDASNVTYRLHDENAKLVPWKEVEATVGVSRQHRTRMVNVLNLAPAVQALVSEHDLSEMTIRPIVAKLRDRPDLQLDAVSQLIAWQKEETDGEGSGRRLVPSVQAYVEQLLKADENSVRIPKNPPKPTKTTKVHKQVKSALKVVDKLSEKDMAAISAEIAQNPDLKNDLIALRTRLNALLNNQ